MEPISNYMKEPQMPDQYRPNIIRRLLTRLSDRIKSLFEPEEVEVTFEVKGNHINYTYTKVEHKKVA